MIQTTPSGGCVTDYEVSVLGLVPGVLGSPLAAPRVDEAGYRNAIYKQDLLTRVERTLADIRSVIDSLPSTTVVADFAFLEGPDHEPYSQVYVWDPVEIVLADAPPVLRSSDEPPEVWR